MQRTFLYISLPLFCTTTTWNFQKLPGYTFYEGNVVHVLVHFFHCRSFSPWCYKISCCSSNKNVSFVFFYLALALFLAEPRWPVALLPLFLCLSLSLFSKFVDMTINLNLMLSTTRIQKYFPLSVFVFIDSLVVSASQDAGGHTLSRQNNLTFGIGLHELDVRISLINTHRHTVLKKYRLKYLILPGNSQGQGKIPGNPKKNIQKCSYTPPPPKWNWDPRPFCYP